MKLVEKFAFVVTYFKYLFAVAIIINFTRSSTTATVA